VCFLYAPYKKQAKSTLVTPFKVQRTPSASRQSVNKSGISAAPGECARVVPDRQIQGIATLRSPYRKHTHCREFLVGKKGGKMEAMLLVCKDCFSLKQYL
jgi:hypothetical protein